MTLCPDPRAGALERELDSTLQRTTKDAAELAGAKVAGFFARTLRHDPSGFDLRAGWGDGAEPRQAFTPLLGLETTAPQGAAGAIRVDDVSIGARVEGSPDPSPLRSYLAATVLAGSGEVLGKLCFGHPDVAVFDARAERVAVAFAAHVAMAIDNARLSQERAVEEENQRVRARHLILSAEIGMALTREKALDQVLQRSSEAIVRNLGAAFARVWILDDAEETLVLRASAGLYTHLDGPHGRVPVGKFKIGLIATERAPHLTNDVLNDPRVGDHAWARREGMVAFAGYPLLVNEHLVGVIAMFARAPLGDQVLSALATVADNLAVGIERDRAERARKQSEDQFRTLVDSMPQLAWSARRDGFIDLYNKRWFDYTGTDHQAMEGWGWRAVHDPAMVDEVAARWSQCIASGVPFEMEFPIRRADGVYRWFLTQAQPLRDAEGHIVRWFGSNTDIDELRENRTRMEALLHEVAEQARSMEQMMVTLRRAKDDAERRAQALQTKLEALTG